MTVGVLTSIIAALLLLQLAVWRLRASIGASVNTLLESNSQREIWLYYDVRNGNEAVMKAHLQKLDQEHENFHLHFCFSKPGADEVAGVDYQQQPDAEIEPGHCRLCISTPKGNLTLAA